MEISFAAFDQLKDKLQIALAALYKKEDFDMGFFDKLFNAGSSEVLDKLKEVAGTVAKEATEAAEAAAKAAGEAIENAKAQNGAASARTSSASASYGSAVSQSSASYGDSGFSWGENMPSEENQFNYPGTYVEYFRHVFSEDFPSYRLTDESVRKGRATVITLWNGEQKALVVELMSETSSAEKIRYSCQKEGIPYLRFYYNHHGWWNTRAYVVSRTRNALGL